MITTSQAWKDYSAEHDVYHIKADMWIPNSGNQMVLTDEDFMFGTVKFTDAVSSESSFDIGAVITNTFECTLNNTSGKFNGFNLEKARIRVKFGIKYENNTEEWITRGTYTIDKPYSLGATIQIIAYDGMDYLNRSYVGKDANYNDIVFPISSTMLCDIMAEVCGYDDFFAWYVPSDVTIEQFEYNESTTWREVLSYICQVNGAFARANKFGDTLEVRWYDQGTMSASDDFDGGTISPWNAVDSADGGTISPWSVGIVLDGGHPEGTLYTQIANYNMYSEDIAVTGVRVYVPNTVSEFEFATKGNQGYILSIENNPFITSENKEFRCADIWNRIRGMSFRPFNASVYGDPSIQAGDMIGLYDYQGNLVTTYITSMVYILNGLTEISCGAETPTNNSNSYASASTSTMAGAVSASYDYIRAKKISADYIDAGTIEAAVVARDFTMQGGSIDIETDDATTDHIILNYRAANESVVSEVSTQRIAFTWDGQGSRTTAELSYDGLVLRDYNTQVANVSFSGISTNGAITATGTVSSNDKMYATGFVNTSRIDMKKNLTKVGSVLDKIKSADILSFNFKDSDEKHIGLAVGGEYNVPEEVIAKDDDGEEQGVDLYSMVSMAWKAIQEQQTIIEELEKRIEVLEKKLNPIGTIKDIIKGDNDGNTDS